MSIDTRARRAADGVRASARGVNPMAQITELKETATSRRRRGMAAQAAVVALVVGGGVWFATTQLTGSSAAPPTAPSTSATPAPQEPTEFVGSNLATPVLLPVPPGWSVDADEAYVWLSPDASASARTHLGLFILDKVWDPASDRAVAPPDDFAQWLRDNPWLEIVDDTTVEVNGEAAVQITYHLRPSAEPGPSGKLRTVKVAGADIGQPWDEYTQGDDSYVTTVTVFEVDGEVVMAEAAGEGGEAEHAAAVATLNQQLAAMTW